MNYPVYVISKGRSDCCLTAQMFIKDVVPFRLVVEPQEADLYANRFGRERIIETPFANLGLGSIPARNFVWEHSVAEGHKKHWIIDDNIREFVSRYRTLRIRCNATIPMQIAEEFSELYEQIGLTGFQYKMFVKDYCKFKPFVVNCRIYSCLLINNELPCRWRGRYNEDTDLALQVISRGWHTVEFNAFLIDKMRTMSMKGGNSDELYQGDGRLKMARSLERLWPGIVKVKRRYGRPQHWIDWKQFVTPLIKKPNAVAKKHQLALKQIAEVNHPELKELMAASLS